MPADQERRVPGAVDEQVARDPPRLARRDRGDVAALARLHPGDVVAQVPYAQPLGRVAAQQLRELPRVEMVGVVERPGIVRHSALPGCQRLRAHPRLRAYRVGEGPAHGDPRGDEVVRRHLGRRGEGMAVAVRPVAPPVEPRSLLERAVRGEQELRLADPDLGERPAHRRPGALADPDRRQVGRFDQRHRDGRHGGGVGRGGDPARGQPARGATADHHHPPDRTVRHPILRPAGEPCPRRPGKATPPPRQKLKRTPPM